MPSSCRVVFAQCSSAMSARLKHGAANCCRNTEIFRRLKAIYGDDAVNNSTLIDG